MPSAFQKPHRYTTDEMADLFIDAYEKKPKSHFFHCLENGLIYDYEMGLYVPLLDENKDLIHVILDFLCEQKLSGVFPTSQNIDVPLARRVLEVVKIRLPNQILTMNSDALIFLKDGAVLNLETNEIFPRPREVFSSLFPTIGIPASSEILSDPSNPQPTLWLSFLEQVLIDPHLKTPDTQLINFMQQLFGYCLLNSIDAHAAFFLYGTGRNGKSVLLNVLRSLFPPYLISSDTISSLTTNRFRLSNLAGRRLNIANEEESDFLRSDLFKAIVSGEVITAERKFGASFDFAPKVKLIFATNELPKFDQVNRAMRDRLFIIPFNAYFGNGKRDPTLTKKLLEEKPLIFKWAIEGARKIIANNFVFPTCVQVENMAAQREEAQSSIIEFVVENCVLTKNAKDFIPSKEFYEFYVRWSQAAGRKGVKSRCTVVREMTARYGEEGVETDAIKLVEGKRVRALTGIQWTSEGGAWVNEENGEEFSSILKPKSSPSSTSTVPF